jgi:hypothetical protein
MALAAARHAEEEATIQLEKEAVVAAAEERRIVLAGE